MNISSVELFRIDPLTGCSNFLGFVEALERLSSRDQKPAFSILYVDLNHLTILNESKGLTYGDTAIRWMEIVLREESGVPTYRIGVDDFAVLLLQGTHSDHEATLLRIYARLNKEAGHLEIPSPAAGIALIHYEKDADLALEDVLSRLAEAIMVVKTKKDRTFNIFQARDLLGADRIDREPDDGEEREVHETLLWIAHFAIDRVVFLGQMLDEAQEAAYIDSISGLPNMRAALLKLDQTLQSAATANQAFSILLMDGDNLRAYNDVSYAVGDKMIKQMGATLSGVLRPSDFLARWRVGDEFITILANTNCEGAKLAGERLRLAIKEASQSWQFPTSISIGIASYPTHGSTINALIDQAENAMKHAKDSGKDRVAAAG